MTVDDALEWANRHLPTNPFHVVRAMEDAGWQVVGGRRGASIRMARPETHRQSLSVPIRPHCPDYPGDMAVVLAELKQAADAGRQAQQVLDAVAALEGVEQR